VRGANVSRILVGIVIGIVILSLVLTSIPGGALR
jgi:hypothetical protein